MILVYIQSMRIRHCAFLATLLLSFSKSSFAQLELSNETTYLSEIVYHTSQTEVTGTNFIGWFLNVTSLTFIENHSLNVGLMLTHGGEPSANIVGDLQTFSNLEAGFLYGFNELFYQYEKNDFWLKLGQVDINSDFFVSENGLLYTHSSFGIDPTTTVNVPAPTYPVVGGSVTTQIPITKNIKVRAGVFDGQFANARNNFLPINWSTTSDEGILFVIEPQFNLFQGRLLQKAGVYHHSGLFVNREVLAPFADLAQKRGLTSFYSTTDLEMKRWNSSRSLHAFLQTTWSQRDVSIIHQYVGFGLRTENLISTDFKNEIGIALAFANVNSENYNASEWNNLAHETVIEITYKQHVNEWLSLQPYFHYMGMKEYQTAELKNPIAVAIRANILF